MTKGQTITVNFILNRQTKGAVRYQEVDEQGHSITTTSGAYIGTLYVRKDKLNGVIPDAMTVTITPK